MPRPNTFDIPFPSGGLVENAAYSRTPPNTTLKAQNVYPFDAPEDRARGGQRPGSSKYIADAVNGTNAIQLLDQITKVLDARGIVPDELLFEDDFIGTDDASIGNGIYEEHGGSEPIGSGRPMPFEARGGTRFEYLSNQAIVDVSEYTTSNNNNVVLRKRGFDVGSFDFEAKYILKSDITIFKGSAVANQARYFIGYFIRGKLTGNNTRHCVVACWARKQGDATAHFLQLRLLEDDSTDTNNPIQALTILAQTDDLPDEPEDGDTMNLELRVNGNFVQLLRDGVPQAWTTGQGQGLVGGATVYDMTDDLSDAGFDDDDNIWTGLYYERYREGGAWNATGDDDDDPKWDNFEIWSGTPPATKREVELVTVSGGSLFAGTKGAGLVQRKRSDATAVLDTVFPVEGVFAFQRFYMVDGVNYQVYNPITKSIADWKGEAPETKPIPLPGGDGDTGQNGSSADGFDGLSRCALISRYRGRIVLSGKADEPHNWFMSAVAQPTDWNVGPGIPGEAVSGNNSDLGEIGDVVRCLIPYIDDRFLFGCDRSIHVLTGDPGFPATSSIKPLSLDVGVLGPRAWAYGPNKSIFFMGQNGLYNISPNQFNIDFKDRISAGKLDRTFENIDTTTHQVQLAWDLYNRGLHIFITPIVEGDTTHFFWDQRTNAFIPQVYPKALGPTSVHVFDADAPGDRAVLLGGHDSVVRFVDSAEADDDGTAIHSFFYLGPIYGLPGREIKLTTMRAVLDEQSDPVYFKVYSGDTAEVALSREPDFSGSWKAGRNQALRNRSRGHALFVEIGSELEGQQFSFETLTMTTVEAGQVRDRLNFVDTGDDEDDQLVPVGGVSLIDLDDDIKDPDDDPPPDDPTQDPKLPIVDNPDFDDCAPGEPCPP